LKSEGYVIISLLARFGEVPVYHAYVIFDKTNNDYPAVTKTFIFEEQVTQFIDDIKNRVRQIQGTGQRANTLGFYKLLNSISAWKIRKS